MKILVFLALVLGAALGQEDSRMFEAQAIVQSVASSASNGEMPLPTLRVEGGEYNPASKNLPVFEQPQPVTLPVRELSPHLVQYPVKTTDHRTEVHRKELTETFIPNTPVRSTR